MNAPRQLFYIAFAHAMSMRLAQIPLLFPAALGHNRAYARQSLEHAAGPALRTPVADGRTKERYVCGDCGHIYYCNPKIVVGSVVVHDNRIMLCHRAIEPRKGFWTLPAGFLEKHETPEDGARREAREEAECDIELDALLAVFAVPRISQVQLMYRARLKSRILRRARKASMRACSPGKIFRGRSLRSECDPGVSHYAPPKI